MKTHRHCHEWDDTAEYIVFGYWLDGVWTECTAWMIPGTQIED